MPKLVLKFENAVLKELPIGAREVSIGRAPDNALVIDNPAVSHYHARIFSEQGRLMLEDFGSLNGTFVNGQRAKMVAVNPGDSIAIGKHTLIISGSGDLDGFAAWTGATKSAAPRINETVMLGTKARHDFLQQVAAIGESAQVAPSRLKIPTLVVVRGKTDKPEYTLTDKLTVIGRSPMASVKLKGWFAPRAAAQISRREDNAYYLSAADKLPSVNGYPALHATKLASGDVIEVAGIQLQFLYRD